MEEVADEIKVPYERIGVIIGKTGEVKKKIEKECGVKLFIDSKSGLVVVERKTDVKDPLKAIKALDIVKAMARGFSPQKAFKLLLPNYYLEIIDLTEYVSDKSLTRVRSRIIGRKGKAKRFIEAKTNTLISIYGKTVAIIGDAESIELAKEAILKLIKGAKHVTVYRFLQTKT